MTAAEGRTQCKNCGFDWNADAAQAIRDVRDAPDRFAPLFGRVVGPPRGNPHEWSATGYLWHVIDVLRFGTERLWTLTFDPAAGVPGWDQDDMARVRRYEELSPKVGVVALRVAVDEWVRAATAAPPEGLVLHPTLGGLTTRDSILRNAHEARHHLADIARTLEQ